MKQFARSTRARLMIGAAAGAIVICATPAFAQEHPRIDLAPQSLASALYEFGRQTGRQVIFSPELTRAKTSQGVSGRLDEQVAMTELLEGTGLTFRRSGNTFMIEDASTPQSGSAAGDGADQGTVAALVVTAQKREEQIQDVPIAISAFTEKSLQEQKIEGGFDLMKAVPNVSFSKNNFTGYNFSIRGIGTKAVSVTTDPAVAVSFNSTTLLRNRLFEQEYFDVERVEVLRGPQGTLYGRNATAGVVNVISAKPSLTDFSGMIKGEVGNYHAKRLSATVNIPLVNDKLAIRIAGALTDRAGFVTNLYNNKPVDGRDLWSTRVSLRFKPVDAVRADLIWERFNENDNRFRTGKQLCTHDYGPQQVGGMPLPSEGAYWELYRGLFEQGCLPGSLYDRAAFGTPNGYAIPFIFFMARTLVANGSDGYDGLEQSHDMRALYSQIDPKYQAHADILQLNVDVDLTPSLTLTSQTLYNKDRVYSSQDYNRYKTAPFFATDTQPLGWGALIHAGQFCDPQLGCSDSIVGMDISRSHSQQFTQELRLQSSFDGPINFSGGVTYTRFRTVEDYYVFFNGATLTAEMLNSIFIVGGTDPSKTTSQPDCSAMGGGIFGQLFGLTDLPDGSICIPIDNSPLNAVNDSGHNYFLSRNPYRLDSRAAFGEVYWAPADKFKVTAGLRFNDDRKTFTPIPSETLLSDSNRLPPLLDALPTIGFDWMIPMLTRMTATLYSFAPGGYPVQPDIHRGWKKWTGRLGVDWKPDLAFTDQTLVYAFYSHGYKAGGMNPPRIGLDYAKLASQNLILAPSAPPEYAPEYVNAFEVGSKNMLMGGALVLNGDAFFYSYKGYQISKIVDRTANNENFDARVWGLELETVFQPSMNLRFNGSIGYLDSSLAKGSKSIDVMNRTAGNPDYVLLKPNVTLTSNCIAPVSAVKAVFDELPYQAPYWINGLCPGGGQVEDQTPTFFDIWNPSEHPEVHYGAGIDTDVSGHELPNSPHWTVTLGAQYSHEVFGNWKATARADGYWQSQSWSRVYELPIDKLHGWYNANVSLKIERPDDGLAFELYAKNVLNDTPITDAFTNSDDTALTTNVFVLDPRLIGLSIKKDF